VAAEVFWQYRALQVRHALDTAFWGQIDELVSEVHALRGIVPICSFCKKIRDDEGYWQAVERYLARQGAVRLSHGICPDCAARNYPDFT
jgi:hypothetical protein